MIQLTLTLKMTTAQVVETSVTVNNNSPIQDNVHPDDQTQPTFEMTPWFKPFTIVHFVTNSNGDDFCNALRPSRGWCILRRVGIDPWYRDMIACGAVASFFLTLYVS